MVHGPQSPKYLNNHSLHISTLVTKTNKNKTKYYVGFLNWFTKKFGVILLFEKSQLNKTYFRLKVRNEGLYLKAPCNCGRTQYGVGATGRTRWLGRLPGGEGGYTPFSPKLGKEGPTIQIAFLSWLLTCKSKVRVLVCVSFISYRVPVSRTSYGAQTISKCQVIGRILKV